MCDELWCPCDRVRHAGNKAPPGSGLFSTMRSDGVCKWWRRECNAISFASFSIVGGHDDRLVYFHQLVQMRLPFLLDQSLESREAPIRIGIERLPFACLVVEKVKVFIVFVIALCILVALDGDANPITVVVQLVDLVVVRADPCHVAFVVRVVRIAFDAFVIVQAIEIRCSDFSVEDFDDGESVSVVVDGRSVFSGPYLHDVWHAGRLALTSCSQ
jgi:hypothetical protein